MGAKKPKQRKDSPELARTKRFFLARQQELYAAGMACDESHKSERALEQAARRFVAAEQLLLEEKDLERSIASAVEPDAPCPERDELDGPGPCEFVRDEDYEDPDAVVAVCANCGRHSWEQPERKAPRFRMTIAKRRVEKMGYRSR